MSVTFRLATLSTESGDRAALFVEDCYYRLDGFASPYGGASVRQLLEQWAAALPVLQALAAQCAKIGPALPSFVPADKVKLEAPVKYPNKLICVGAVYRDHLIEFGLPPERWPNMPIFMRAPTTSIVGPGATLQIPATTKQFDWEIELAVIVGRRLQRGSQDEAAEAIAAFSIGLDMTCRDLLDRNSPTGVDLIRAKAQDGMAPMGSWITPAAFVGDPQSLCLKLWVNGEAKQNSNTSNMLYSVHEQLSTISQYITLEPGDVVFTGSPAGSGASTGRFLQPGDRIRAEIERIGHLDMQVIEQVQQKAYAHA